MLGVFLFLLVPVCASLALAYAWLFYKTMMETSEGEDRMKEIASYVRVGAKTYLWQQYKVVGIFFLCAFLFFVILSFGLHVQSAWTPFAFLTGGFFSGLAGFFGMMTATNASARTANAARESLNASLQIAFRSGAVMGFVVVGLGLLDICLWFLFLKFYWINPNSTGIWAVKDLHEITTIMLTFGMGASFQAMFARVGGGIFTKAADVGADLVGKVEEGIPEDDPRNPATIADNVGDNVGDVAGMGADLYESYCGSILAAAALGAAAFNGTDYAFNAVILPMVISGFGILASLWGVYAVKSKEDATQGELLSSLSRGTNLSSFMIGIFSVFVVFLLLPYSHFGIIGSVMVGLVSGILIGKATEYYTSSEYEPTKQIAKRAETGSATVIIDGIAVGMLSTSIPVATVCVSSLLAFGFSSAFDFDNLSQGLYGVGIAAVSMLSTLGITLATDAYGPIADNAGGNAEMSKLDKEVRDRTDALDALGNTTAATGKGFAIGSAALTATALLAAYIEEVRVGIIRAVESGVSIKAGKQIIDSVEVATSASIQDFMSWYEITLMNPRVLAGLFLGSMAAFVFCALTMKSVSRAAGLMVQEVRRQFKEKKGILSGKELPDYAACVEISTKAAQREMLLPSLLAMLVPVFTGIVLGIAGVMGLLSGVLVTAFTLAVVLNNAGGAWDNAKKYIESGKCGGKGSNPHKSAVIGDMVGDPFKDTSGPSLNILIKLMSMTSVVVAGLVLRYSLF